MIAKKFSYLSMGMAAVILLVLSGCGKNASPAAEAPTAAGDKQVSPTGISAPGTKAQSIPAQPANPLLAAVRAGTIERISQADSKFALKVDFTLEQNGQFTRYVFQSDTQLEGPHTYLMGYMLKMKHCTDDSCKAFSPEIDKLPVAVTLRCNARACGSSLAIVKGDNGQFQDNEFAIEHQVMNSLVHRAVSSVFLKSQQLKDYEKLMKEPFGIARTGNIEVTRVQGTQLQKVSAYTKITPTWSNDVFERKAKPETDVTKLPQYFVKTIGVSISRELDGKVSQFIFDWEQQTNTSIGFGGSRPGRVSIQWKPASGQLLVEMQDAFDFPHPEQDDGGTLGMGFLGEQLLKPALDDQAAPTIDPFWMF